MSLLSAVSVTFNKYKVKDADDERLYFGGFYRDILSLLTYKNILQLKETCLIKNSEPLNREFTERKNFIMFFNVQTQV